MTARTRKHLMTAVLAAALVAPATFAAAQDRAPNAPPDKNAIAMGLALTNMYCADCHAIGETGDSPFPAAPPLRDVRGWYDVDQLDEVLVEGLVSAHPDMPEFEFDPRQAHAIITYLKSLGPDPNQPQTDQP